LKPETRLLIESFRLITRNIHQGGKIWMNQSIQKRVKWLFREYGITRQEIIEQLKDEFERRNMHRRHNPDKSCLETYVLTFCYYGMLSLVKKYKKNLGETSSISQTQNKQGEKIDGRSGASYEPYEKDGIKELLEPDTPEDLLIGKELFDMALDHFGQDDLEVLLGAKDRDAVARQLGIGYDTYQKRLERKRRRFKSILHQAGYID
jgi:hypothetical protein